MPYEFVIPDFLKNQSFNEIMTRMLRTLPDTISKEENGWICDLFAPVAVEKAQAAEFLMVEAIKSLIPKYASGEILKEHGANRGIVPKPAQKARTVLTVGAKEKTYLPKGYLFSTKSTLEESGILFSTDNEVTLDKSEVIQIPVTCQNAGSIGNVAAETILLMVKPQKGVISVTNNEPAYGGFDAESDDSLRERIMEYDRTQGKSFVGSMADYKRWAQEVEGVGGVKVIPAADDTGLVTIILTDSNGSPADKTICDNVYHYIMRPDAPEQRLAPCNAYLKVIPPDTMKISVSAKIKMKDGYCIEGIKNDFVKSMMQYFKTEAAHKEVKYAQIGAILIHTEGVLDYSDFIMNGGFENIAVLQGQLPEVDRDRVVLIL